MTTYSDLINVSELNLLLGHPDCRLVDCRFDLFDPDKGRADFLAGHIPGAVYADMDKDLAGAVTENSGRHPLPAVDVFRETLQAWGIGNDTQVVAYDYGNGALAARLWWMLRWLGHDAVAVLDGGFEAWQAGSGTIETEATVHPRAAFAASPDASMIATTQEIEALVRAGRRFDLVDARDAARFRGEKEPIDAVAGHIPGALNMPMSRNLQAEGRWRDAQALSANWNTVLPARSGERPIVMCGSGVTACHLILAASIAGLNEPRLYVGSWSEWIRDSRRPVETSE